MSKTNAIDVGLAEPGAPSIVEMYPEDIVDMWIADGRNPEEPGLFLTFKPHRECPCAHCTAAFKDTDGPS